MPNFHALTLDRAAIDLLLVCDYIVSTRQGIIMKIDIIKIGNSRGIRLPKAVIEGASQDIPGFEVRSLPDSPSVESADLKPLPALFG